MAYQKKEWVNRQSEYPNRRILTRTGTADEYEVTRSEGLVIEEGDPLDANSFNDLEQRIEDAFKGLDADGDNVVDKADDSNKLGGHEPGHYATKEEVQNAQKAAGDAATAAGNAQSTADSAVTKANNAQTTANNAMPKSAYILSGTTLTINW